MRILSICFWKLRSREECGSCRSRQALSNAYLVAKIGFDKEENGAFKVRQEENGAFKVRQGDE